MILADKIITLRKKQGWSQEELAHQLNVSRQAVSKWESTASIPELDKIIRMSQLFGVSTDYLLIDDLENVEYAEYEDTIIRKVDLETANHYLDVAKIAYKKIAQGVVLCILAPITLISLSIWQEANPIAISENVAVSIGIFVLFFLVFIAIILFITYSMKLSKFKYLDEEAFELDYGVKGVIEKRSEPVQDKLNQRIITAIGIIFFAVIQLIISTLIWENSQVYSLPIFVFLVSIAVYLLTYHGMVKTSYSKLLQQGDYSPKVKEAQKKAEAFSGFYWILVTALYIGSSLLSMRWDRTWIIWPIAALIFAAISTLITKE